MWPQLRSESTWPQPDGRQRVTPRGVDPAVPLQRVEDGQVRTPCRGRRSRRPHQTADREGSGHPLPSAVQSCRHEVTGPTGLRRDRRVRLLRWRAAPRDTDDVARTRRTRPDPRTPHWAAATMVGGWIAKSGGHGCADAGRIHDLLETRIEAAGFPLAGTYRTPDWVISGVFEQLAAPGMTGSPMTTPTSSTVSGSSCSAVTARSTWPPARRWTSASRTPSPCAAGRSSRSPVADARY